MSVFLQIKGINHPRIRRYILENDSVLHVDALYPFLSTIRLLPYVVALETPGVRATIPLLRGVWGAALHELDRTVYDTVFAAKGADVPPGYLLRPAEPDPALASTAVHWILFGAGIRQVDTLRRGWDVASGMGLGPERRRFVIRRFLVLGPDGAVTPDSVPWSLDAARWPLLGNAETIPCRLVFRAPLRILRKGRLIEEPTLADLVVAVHRRVSGFISREQAGAWGQLRAPMLDVAHQIPTTAWQGDRLDLQRWSASQQAELEVRGVSGSLTLPDGPGILWPLLLAGSWLHLGKGTTLGLGELRIERLSR